MNSDQTHLSEDTVSQSGWVFADLLVALSVIFLATISFVPNIGNGTQSGSIALEPGKILRSEGFTQLYREVSVEKLVADIQAFRDDQNISESVEIVSIQIIGSASESTSKSGILEALEFSVELQNANLDEFTDASISIDTSQKLLPGEMVVRAVFGAR